MKINKDTSEHYIWGQNCDGWHLLKKDSLSIIQERMPPKSFETLHFHNKAQQFFYILSGEATFELEGEVFVIKTNEGFYVEPNKKHKIKNESEFDLHFLT